MPKQEDSELKQEDGDEKRGVLFTYYMQALGVTTVSSKQFNSLSQPVVQATVRYLTDVFVQAPKSDFNPDTFVKTLVHSVSVSKDVDYKRIATIFNQHWHIGLLKKKRADHSVFRKAMEALALKSKSRESQLEVLCDQRYRDGINKRSELFDFLKQLGKFLCDHAVGSEAAWVDTMLHRICVKGAEVKDFMTLMDLLSGSHWPVQGFLSNMHPAEQRWQCVERAVVCYAEHKVSEAVLKKLLLYLFASQFSHPTKTAETLFRNIGLLKKQFDHFDKIANQLVDRYAIKSVTEIINLFGTKLNDQTPEVFYFFVDLMEEYVEHTAVFSGIIDQLITKKTLDGLDEAKADYEDDKDLESKEEGVR